MAKPRANDRQPAKELDPRQSRAWLAYMRVSLQMTYEMNHQLVTESELSLSDYHVLSKLHQEPTRKLRIAALAREIGWERSRASHQVRRMTKRGLIDSEPATDDRRGTVVTVTARGKAAFRDARRGHVELVRELFFSGLPEHLLAPLTEALEATYESIRERGSTQQ
jgi:DNA-binding MarR family transcriptional regulator